MEYCVMKRMNDNMDIIYLGKERFDNQILSKYEICIVDDDFFTDTIKIFREEYFCTQNKGLFYYSIAKRCFKIYKPLLYNWLEACKISFGGFVEPYFGKFKIFILFVPGSADEMSFRLCYNVKVESL